MQLLYDVQRRWEVPSGAGEGRATEFGTQSPFESLYVSFIYFARMYSMIAILCCFLPQGAR